MPTNNDPSETKNNQIPLRQYTRLLGAYLKPQLTRVVVLGALLMLSIGLQLMIPQILRYFIDAARESAALKNLTYAAMLFIGLSLVNQGVVVAMAILGNNVAWSATNALRADVAEHCLGLAEYIAIHAPVHELELSVDETDTPTSVAEHLFRDLDDGQLCRGLQPSCRLVPMEKTPCPGQPDGIT